MNWRRGFSRPVLILCILIGVLAGLGAHTFHFADGLAYMGNDPKSCVNCHIMRDVYDGWQVSTHHNHATCNDCHVPEGGVAKWICKADNGYRHSKGFTFQDFHEPIQITSTNAEILQQNCIRCHKQFVSSVLGAPDEKGCYPTDSINCVRCHQNVGHGPSR